MNTVFETNAFSKIFNSLEKSEQVWIEKIKDQLVEHLLVGKPLRFPWFREKKLGNKRLYYIINESTQKAILVSFGSKKEQDDIIRHIIINKERYLRVINEPV